MHACCTRQQAIVNSTEDFFSTPALRFVYLRPQGALNTPRCCCCCFYYIIILRTGIMLSVFGCRYSFDDGYGVSLVIFHILYDTNTIGRRFDTMR